ncbi:hypothetical protein N7470_002903 [Penicillium chermesinum]|nr:hypothetical protein N7470_002903 [Penicillium chermesinum]
MSKTQKVVLWKDSIIPLMMSQLQTTPEHEISSLKDVNKVNVLSRDIRVSLIQEEKEPLTFTEI